jgi:hypothetical protein
MVYSPSVLENQFRHDRLCSLVFRVSGCRYRGPGFNSWHCQIFLVVVDLEWGPLSLMRINEKLLESESTS